MSSIRIPLEQGLIGEKETFTMDGKQKSPASPDGNAGVGGLLMY